MARPKSTQPTDGELELLKLLWDLGPCELGQVCTELRRKRSVATTTVATMLNVMLGKGLVKRARKPQGYVWSARVGREATTRGLVDRLIDRAFDGSAELLMAHLVESKLSEKDRRQVLALLAKGAAKSRGRNAPDSKPSDPTSDEGGSRP